MALPDQERAAQLSAQQLTGSLLTRFLNAALSAVGVAYHWGGNYLNGTGTKGVDCSGLVYMAARYAGYRLPRTASMQQSYTQPVRGDAARAGDLVFWPTAGSHDRVAGADHVGIYLGNGMVLEASSSQNKVVIRKLWGKYTFGRITKGKGTPENVPLGRSGITIQTLAASGTITGAPPPGPEGEQSTNAAGVASMQMAQAKLAPTASEKEIVDFIIENYGMAARAFLQIPELRKALVQAAQAGAVGDRGLEYVYKTRWWQTRTEAQRTWDILEKSNPKEAADRIAKRTAMLAPLWENFGVDEDIKTVARDFERLAMNDAQLNVLMAKSLQAESDRTGLDRGTKGATTADDLIRIARMEYLTPIDQQTAERWAIKAIRTGTDVEAEFRQYLAGLASHRFGLDPASGVAPADALSPIKSAIAENLEINPEAVDLLDPKYAEVMQVRTAEGTYRPMTSAEATEWARSQEAFKGTKVAEEASSNLAEVLAKTFGQVG